MKGKPNLITLIVLIAFSTSQFASAQEKPGVIMVVKLINNYPRPFQDTLAKFWSKGDILKTWFLGVRGTYETKGNSEGITEQSFTLAETSKDTSKFTDKSHHSEYIQNLRTGDAIHVTYNKTEIVVCKITEKPNPPADSTDEEWLPEQKIIAGHPCKKMISINRVTKVRDTMFVAVDIKNLKNPFFKNLKYFPMEFSDKIITYKVISLEVADIPDEIFAVPRGSVIFNNEKDWINYLFKDTMKKEVRASPSQ